MSYNIELSEKLDEIIDARIDTLKKVLDSNVNNDVRLTLLEWIKEECGELIVAASHFKRERVTEIAVVEEMVDVLLVVLVMKKLFASDEMWQKMVDEKVAKMQKRIKEIE